LSRLVVDTSVLIDATRENPKAITYLDEASRQHELWSVTPVRTELRWSMHPNEQWIIEEVVASLAWLDVDGDLADRAGEFGARWGRSHGLDIVDAIVAAAAEFLSADLATLNVRDFPMFPDLKPPY
jgi:predicted nucleic acid-binding protein